MSDTPRILPGSELDNVVEAAKPKTKQPPMFKVVVVNDAGVGVERVLDAPRDRHTATRFQ